jgi:hypothetical protein
MFAFRKQRASVRYLSVILLGWVGLFALVVLYWDFSADYAPDERLAAEVASRDGVPSRFRSPVLSWVPWCCGTRNCFNPLSGGMCRNRSGAPTTGSLTMRPLLSSLRREQLAIGTVGPRCQRGESMQGRTRSIGRSHAGMKVSPVGFVDTSSRTGLPAALHTWARTHGSGTRMAGFCCRWCGPL